MAVNFMTGIMSVVSFGGELNYFHIFFGLKIEGLNCCILLFQHNAFFCFEWFLCRSF